MIDDIEFDNFLDTLDECEVFSPEETTRVADYDITKEFLTEITSNNEQEGPPYSDVDIVINNSAILFNNLSKGKKHKFTEPEHLDGSRIYITNVCEYDRSNICVFPNHQTSSDIMGKLANHSPHGLAFLMNCTYSVPLVLDIDNCLLSAEDCIKSIINCVQSVIDSNRVFLLTGTGRHKKSAILLDEEAVIDDYNCEGEYPDANSDHISSPITSSRKRCISHQQEKARKRPKHSEKVVSNCLPPIVNYMTFVNSNTTKRRNFHIYFCVKVSVILYDYICHKIQELAGVTVDTSVLTICLPYSGKTPEDMYVKLDEYSNTEFLTFKRCYDFNYLYKVDVDKSLLNISQLGKTNTTDERYLIGVFTQNPNTTEDGSDNSGGNINKSEADCIMDMLKKLRIEQRTKNIIMYQSGVNVVECEGKFKILMRVSNFDKLKCHPHYDTLTRRMLTNLLKFFNMINRSDIRVVELNYSDKELDDIVLKNSGFRKNEQMVRLILLNIKLIFHTYCIFINKLCKVYKHDYIYSYIVYLISLPDSDFKYTQYLLDIIICIVCITTKDNIKESETCKMFNTVVSVLKLLIKTTMKHKLHIVLRNYFKSTMKLTNYEGILVDYVGENQDDALTRLGQILKSTLCRINEEMRPELDDIVKSIEIDELETNIRNYIDSLLVFRINDANMCYVFDYYRGHYVSESNLSALMNFLDLNRIGNLSESIIVTDSYKLIKKKLNHLAKTLMDNECLNNLIKPMLDNVGISNKSDMYIMNYYINQKVLQINNSTTFNVHPHYYNFFIMCEQGVFNTRSSVISTPIIDLYFTNSRKYCLTPTIRSYKINQIKSSNSLNVCGKISKTHLNKAASEELEMFKRVYLAIKKKGVEVCKGSRVMYINEEKTMLLTGIVIPGLLFIDEAGDNYINTVDQVMQLIYRSVSTSEARTHYVYMWPLLMKHRLTYSNVAILMVIMNYILEPNIIHSFTKCLDNNISNRIPANINKLLLKFHITSDECLEDASEQFVANYDFSYTDNVIAEEHMPQFMKKVISFAEKHLLQCREWNLNVYALFNYSVMSGILLSKYYRDKYLNSSHIDNDVSYDVKNLSRSLLKQGKLSYKNDESDSPDLVKTIRDKLNNLKRGKYFINNNNNIAGKSDDHEDFNLKHFTLFCKNFTSHLPENQFEKIGRNLTINILNTESNNAVDYNVYIMKVWNLILVKNDDSFDGYFSSSAEEEDYDDENNQQTSTMSGNDRHFKINKDDNKSDNGNDLPNNTISDETPYHTNYDSLLKTVFRNWLQYSEAGPMNEYCADMVFKLCAMFNFDNSVFEDFLTEFAAIYSVTLKRRKVKMLYGSTCAGKSTLAKILSNIFGPKLTNQKPCNWQSVGRASHDNDLIRILSSELNIINECTKLPADLIKTMTGDDAANLRQIYKAEQPRAKNMSTIITCSQLPPRLINNGNSDIVADWGIKNRIFILPFMNRFVTTIRNNNNPLLNFATGHINSHEDSQSENKWAVNMSNLLYATYVQRKTDNNGNFVNLNNIKSELLKLEIEKYMVRNNLVLQLLENANVKFEKGLNITKDELVSLVQEQCSRKEANSNNSNNSRKYETILESTIDMLQENYDPISGTYVNVGVADDDDNDITCGGVADVDSSNKTTTVKSQNMYFSYNPDNLYPEVNVSSHQGGMDNISDEIYIILMMKILNTNCKVGEHMNLITFENIDKIIRKECPLRGNCYKDFITTLKNLKSNSTKVKNRVFYDIQEKINKIDKHVDKKLLKKINKFILTVDDLRELISKLEKSGISCNFNLITFVKQTLELQNIIRS